MKRMFKSLSLILALVLCLGATSTLSGCTSSTEYGECVGAFDDKDPNLNYKVSGWNVAMAVIFVEMIFPPILVIVNETHCPVSRKVVQPPAAPVKPAPDAAPNG